MTYLGQLDGPGLVGGNGIPETVQRDSAWEGVSLQLGGRDNDVYRHLLEAADRAAALGVRRWGDLTHEDGVRGGNVFERHSDGKLGSKLLIQRLLGCRKQYVLLRQEIKDTTLGREYMESPSRCNKSIC